MIFPTGVVSVILSLVSGYALSQSLLAATNLHKYEHKAEKAAEWSKTAKARLWDIRYTIGTGLVSCLVSLSSALAYSFILSSGGSLLSAPLRTIWPALLAVGLRFGASRYIADFWATKTKMPLLDQYNAAIKESVEVAGFLDVLSVGWTIVAVLKLVGL